MSKRGDYPIPFDKNGNPQGYPQQWYEGEYPNAKRAGPIWRDNIPFKATLEFTGYGRGRSSAVLKFKDGNGIEYEMFLSSFDECARLMCYGKIEGTWWFVKKGQNYGVALKEAFER